MMDDEIQLRIANLERQRDALIERHMDAENGLTLCLAELVLEIDKKIFLLRMGRA